jgi:hypothetical protein
MKTVTIGNMELPLTDERIRRIKQAQAETQRLIDREMKYSVDFRNHERIAEWQAHIAKLDTMMA